VRSYGGFSPALPPSNSPSTIASCASERHNAAASKGASEAFFAGQTVTSSEMRVPKLDAPLATTIGADETLPSRFTAILPTRNRMWLPDSETFPIKAAREVTQMASLAVEVTGNRKLERYFRKLGGKLLWQNAEYQRLARELPRFGQ